jgi:DNA-binding Lrp family transcriptional regulator
MDTLDLKIIDALQEDGRLTNPELAERVGLSPSQCSRRRSALEASGIIAGYYARVDPTAVGLNTVVFVQVTLATHSPNTAQRFKELIARLDAVQEAYALTGAADYQVKLVLPDLAALNDLLSNVFLPHESVQQVHSLVVLDCLKQTTHLPLSQLRE